MKFDEIVARLEKAGIESAKEEATAIMKEIGVSYGELVFFRGKDYDSKELCDLVAKREKRIPLQYATQKAYFMDSEFYVTPDCLIPRADRCMQLVQQQAGWPRQGFRIVGGSMAGGMWH